MDTERREALMEQYLQALDTDDVGLLEAIVAPDFTFHYTDRVLRGREETLAFFEHERDLDTDHAFTRVLHDEACSVGVGEVEGVGPDGPFTGEMCDVFVFDEDELTLESVKIFARD